MKVLQSVPERKEAFLKHFPRFGYKVYKTCAYVGITRATFYNYTRDDADFKRDFDSLQESNIDEHEETLSLLALGIRKTESDGRGKKVFKGWIERPDMRALKLFLEAKAKIRGYGSFEIITNNIEDEIKGKTKENILKDIERLKKVFIKK